jgi:benzoyl-CoA reductase/2-hydroxyglutaryl-CoA dehydratase subunit BcrC/BadD/HgdB
MAKNDLYEYPQELREEFEATEAIQFRDGSQATGADIWHFMTEVAPKKYPFAYTQRKYVDGRMSRDIHLPSAIKHNYLLLTMNDRINKSRENGSPVIFVQGGQSVDPYYAAGGIALRPASVGMWSRGRHEGLGLNEEIVRRHKQKEKANHAISFEACQTAGYASIQEEGLPVDMVAPFSCLRCSDISYGLEAHRHGPNKTVKLMNVDYPLRYQADKSWAVEYFAQNLRRLTSEIGKMAGRDVTDDDLSKEIKLHNEGRRLAIDTADIWWSADLPPTNGLDRRHILQMGGMEVHGDPSASLTVLRESNAYIRDRVKRGIKAEGVVDKPVRLFICGSCVRPNDFRIEEAGAIIVGHDNHWSDISTLVEEEGDPFKNLAHAILSYPYEQSIEGRAAWTIEQLKKSRADGVLFLYQWGCNTQSAVARMLCDVIKRDTGIPTMVIEQNESGTEQSEQLLNRINAFVEMLG